ncbi:MAG: hypothetical protein J6D54_00285 [Olsenella sp.]|nr:hypothetical protein [Olsenella sp.]
MATKKSHVGRNVLLVILVVLITYGGILAWSAYNVRGHATQASARMQECVAQIQREDLGSAYASAQTAEHELSVAKSELQGWQWALASHVPVVCDDVRCAQQSTDVADVLVRDALLPVIGQARDLASVDVANEGIGALASGFTRLTALVGAASDARGVVRDGKVRVAAIPKAHINELNELVKNLSEVIDKADSALGAAGAAA